MQFAWYIYYIETYTLPGTEKGQSTPDQHDFSTF